MSRKSVKEIRRALYDAGNLRCPICLEPFTESEAIEGRTVTLEVPLRDRCSFGRFAWLISQALSVTYVAGEHRLYLERDCRLPESPAHSRRRNREEPASSKGLEQSARVRPSDRTSAKVEAAFHGFSWFVAL